MPRFAKCLTQIKCRAWYLLFPTTSAERAQVSTDCRNKRQQILLAQCPCNTFQSSLVQRNQAIHQTPTPNTKHQHQTPNTKHVHVPMGVPHHQDAPLQGQKAPDSTNVAGCAANRLFGHKRCCQKVSKRNKASNGTECTKGNQPMCIEKGRG